MRCETHARSNDSKTAQDATWALDDSLWRWFSKNDAWLCGLSCDLSVQLGRLGHVNPLYKRSPTEMQKAIRAQTYTDCDTLKGRARKTCSDFTSPLTASTFTALRGDDPKTVTLACAVAPIAFVAWHCPHTSLHYPLQVPRMCSSPLYQ